MNSRIIILAVAVLGLASCSTAYRTGQTPDDVYYSPERQRDAYVVVDQNDRRYNDDRYYNPDDNYLRMMSRNRYRWSAFDDYYWMDSRRNFGFNSGFGMYSGIGFNPFFNPWSFNGFYPNYWTWNNWYNPYGNNHVVISPGKNPNIYNRFKTFNAGSYGNQNYSNTNAGRYNYSNGKVRPTYNNTNRNNNNQLGTSIRKVFSNDRDYNNSGDRPVRTYNPNSNNNNSYSPSRSTNTNSGSSSGSSSGSRPSGSRPGRGN